MNSHAMKSAILAFGGVALLLLLTSGPSAFAATTAQSVMFNSTLPTEFVIEQSETWAFDSQAARTYYINEWNGNDPTVTCTGGGQDGCQTRPSTPPAPAPDRSKVPPIANGEKCTFFNGGTLTGTDTYTQTVPVNVSSGPSKGSWKFTYTYNIAPDPNKNPVAPRTAWNLIHSSGASTVPVEVNGKIAGQSVVQNDAKGKRTWNRKYSFTLLNPDGSSRITDLKITVSGTDTNGNPVDLEAFPGHTVDTNPGDFEYTGNAGTNGVTALLVPGPAMVSDILQGNVTATDGGKDDFSQNDVVVGYVHLATKDPVTFDLGPGTYTVTISGKVKGTDGNLDISLGVTQQLTISAEGCQ